MKSYIITKYSRVILFSNFSKGIKSLLVALDNAEVHLYRDKVCCDVIKAPDVVSGMRFGKFGREDSTLVMTTKGGGLIIKILKRNANFDNADYGRSAPLAPTSKY